MEATENTNVTVWSDKIKELNTQLEEAHTARLMETIKTPTGLAEYLHDRMCKLNHLPNALMTTQCNFNGHDWDAMFGASNKEGSHKYKWYKIAESLLASANKLNVSIVSLIEAIEPILQEAR